MRHRAQLESVIKRFEDWRQVWMHSVSDRYCSLSKAAIRAGEVLSKFRDCEDAWSALALFYHSESQLSAIFDWLMFAKASNWLEADSTAVEVFQTWRHYAA
jgi:hypothetical protein